MVQIIIEQENENQELKDSLELMNQTISQMDQKILQMNQTMFEQALLYSETQQALENMNASNAEDVQNLLSTVVGIQLNLSLIHI